MRRMEKKESRHATLYRQYRPQSFNDARGQEHIVKVLKAEIKNKKPAHAYLFSGGRGTGKTTFARILARELGVSDKDLYEIDAASNNGVEHIRELREGVHVVPFESPYKFYIVDEAHMLSKSAWNAFLKTLEEPPPHAMFVLATTERDKIPDTIQSRCEVYSFKQPSNALLLNLWRFLPMVLSATDSPSCRKYSPSPITKRLRSKKWRRFPEPPAGKLSER
ncbi:MAG: polymerase III gamma and tau subunit protein [Candidatus Kaiserbacteria bacterium GW2011_GWC2_49_12]|uniref:Polymerase III gamma and tau subunit protein n=1 Tax=Candidatus Kaiserbacteria bacterium GW2011_GWC2_49_12 TaxID=1618675 RepID=A0A0G1VJ88_9BACT|nr:MAG: polymerase III gamma and tau subunit protein [Candidatus Kaiserbacteria bacterium GW2011_GWC2_49_12]